MSLLDYFKDDEEAAVAPAPAPIIVDDEVIARAEKQADLFAQQQAARRQGEYWEGVTDRIDRLTGQVVEPLTRPLSGAVGRAADAAANLVTGSPQATPQTPGMSERVLSSPGIQLPKAGEAETPLGKIAAGTYNAATDLIASLSSPDAVALLPAAANKTVLTAWVSQMAGHQPERVMKATALFKEGKTQEAIQEVAAGIGEVGMAELGRRHVMRDPLRPTMADATDATIDPRFAQEAALEATNPRNAQRVVMPESLREAAREPSPAAAVPKAAEPVVEPAAEVKPADVKPAEAPAAPEPVLPEKMAGKPVAEIAASLESLLPEKLSEYQGHLGGGPTGLMHTLGSMARTAEDVAALKEMGLRAKAKIAALKEEMNNLPDEDAKMAKLMEAAAEAGKQPWEAYEFATGMTIDGKPKWEGQEKVFARKGMDYKPTVPDAQYVKAKGGPAATPKEVTDAAKATETERTPSVAAPVPEKIQSAAVRTADGTIYTGKWHPAAYEGYMKAKGGTHDSVVSELQEGKIQDGFITESGRFVDRNEAAQIAGKSNQFKPGKEGDTAFAGGLKGITDGPGEISPVAPKGIAASVRKPGALGGGEAGAISLAPVQAAVNAFKTKARQNLPRLKDVSKEPLPDLGDRAANTKIATEPTGIGRTPALGWLLDPRQRATLPHEKAILTWFYEKAVGDAHVQALASTFGTRFNKLFPRTANGEINNVRTTQPGQSRHPSDVFEALQRDPNSYVLTPEQRAGFNELMGYEQKLRTLAKKYKIRFDEETGDFVSGAEGQTPYWTRGRTVKKGVEPRTPGGTMVGAKQYFQKGRTFKTEAEGVAKGFEYPLNVDARLVLRAERLYKAIADRRLAADKGLGGRWGGKPTYEEGYSSQPAFRREFTMDTPEGPQHVAQSKIFPIKTANALNKAFGNQSSGVGNAVSSANNFLKSLALGFDFGVGQIQLLGTAYKNPGLWGKANWQAMKAFGNRDVFAKYAEQNAEPIRELAQYGSSVGRLPEMMAGLESGELMTAAPRALGKAITDAGAPRVGKAVASVAEVPAAFSRQFQTFMDVAKVELWKARRDAVPREEWAREIQAIESQLLSSNMERIGITPSRALAERMLLLAPSYYRGALNQIGGLAEKGASGETYRRAMGSYMVGMTATFVGMALAAGLSWEDIRKRLNPTRGDFMMVPIKTGEKSIEVGFGGIMRSYMRLAGEIAETSVEHPGNWASLSPEKNPVTRWLRGHSAPVLSKSWDAFSGKDYMGEDADIGSLGKGALPLASQQLFGEKKSRDKAGVALETAAQLTGLSSFPGKSTKQKVGSLYREWLEKQTDPKIKADYERGQGAMFPNSKYEKLDDALSVRDEASAVKALAALKAEGQKDKDILERMRPFVGEGINSRAKPLFHGSRKMESEFLNSLNAQQRALYEQAKEERKATYQAFLKAWAKRGSPAAPASTNKLQDYFAD